MMNEIEIKDKNQWIDVFLGACNEGNLRILKHACEKKYLDLGWADIHRNQEQGFRWACDRGHVEIAKYLLTSQELIKEGQDWVNVHADRDEGFYRAWNQKRWDLVRWFIFEYEIEETKEIKEIKEIIEYDGQLKEYFRTREEKKQMQDLLNEKEPHLKQNLKTKRL